MPNFTDAFKTQEELVAFVTERITARDGSFFLDDIITLQTESDKRKTLLNAEIREKKDAVAKYREIVESAKKLEESNSEYLSKIEILEDPAKKDEKVQALSKEIATVRSEARAKDQEIAKLAKMLDETKVPLEELGQLKVEAKNSRILQTVRKAAIDAKVPQGVYDSEDFQDHILARFVIDEVTDEVVTRGDSPLGPQQFVASKQKANPIWIEASQFDGARPGTKSPSLDGRTEQFKKAADKGDYFEMIRNAPAAQVQG